MSNFCQDRDLLSIEPELFADGNPCQTLASGTNGVIAGTTFSSTGSNFEAAGARAGMVLHVGGDSPETAKTYEIVSVDSATQLTVSRLRADDDDDPLAPTTGTEMGFSVRTFAPQIRTVSQTLAEKLRQVEEVAGVAAADFADSVQLRMTAACGTLAAIFVTRSENATSADANWAKAEHYRTRFERLGLQLRLTVDVDGDGLAEQTRALGNVTLRRA